MKHLSGILSKLTAVAAVAVALSSCSRGEYAVLPKTTPYHETHRSVALKPAAAPVAADAPQAVTAPEVAAAPAQAPVAAAPSVAKAAPVQAAPAPHKLTLVQKLAVAKVLKQVNKASDKVQLKKHQETASASKLSGKLRQGVILLIVGLLLEILGAATGLGIIYILGAIVAIVGVILIVLYLLDEL